MIDDRKTSKYYHRRVKTSQLVKSRQFNRVGWYAKGIKHLETLQNHTQVYNKLIADTLFVICRCILY